MANVKMIRLGFPMNQNDLCMDAEELRQALGTFDKYQIIDDLIRDQPMVIEVDGEVWKSVDPVSTDQFKVVVELPHAYHTGDQLEDLADTFAFVQAARDIFRQAGGQVNMKVEVY